MEQNNKQVHGNAVAHGMNWYDKRYKLLLILPALMIIFAALYLINFNSQTGDIINKDVSLTGGTIVTVFDGNASIQSLQNYLKIQFPDLLIRAISDIRTGQQQGFFLQTKADSSVVKEALEKYLGYKLTSSNSSVEFSGSTLSSGFYLQLKSAVMAAFLLMACVVFFIFGESRKLKGIGTMLTFLGTAIILSGIGPIKGISFIGISFGLIFGLMHKNKAKNDWLIILITGILSYLLIFLYPSIFLIIPIALILLVIYTSHSIPSIAVILSAFADIIMTIVAVDMMGMRISTAGIVAFLMLIGYSVDTDILLTTRLLKNHEGTVNHRIFEAFKTGITMTLTAIASVLVSLIIVYNISDTLRQIFTIIFIGLLFDIINTWITNASILKWYMGAHKIQ